MFIIYQNKYIIRLVFVFEWDEKKHGKMNEEKLDAFLEGERIE